MVKASKIVDLDEYRMLKALGDELEEFPFDDDFLEDEEDELDSENWNLFEDLTELRKRVDYYQELHENGEISEKDYYFSKVNLGIIRELLSNLKRFMSWIYRICLLVVMR